MKVVRSAVQDPTGPIVENWASASIPMNLRGSLSARHVSQERKSRILCIHIRKESAFGEQWTALTAHKEDIFSLDRDAAALSHMIQIRGSTVVLPHGSPEPSAAKHLVQPPRGRSHDKMFNNEVRGQRHQGAAPDQEFDVDLMAMK